jgi:DNA-binding CsgD family transcriptional regulator
MPDGGVHERLRATAVQIVGREAELAALDEFADPGRLPRALVLSGGPGIGKTTLWEAGVAVARERGMRLLSTRASGAEAKLSFAGLIDLFDEVDREELSGLPRPQLRALEVALLRAEPGGAPPKSGAIALGFLNALRALAAREPVLVAIDDVQWLDAPSADALAFAARRLERESAGFLLSRRPGRVSGLERAFGPRLDRLEVGSLSLGAVRRLLSERLGLALSRHLLRRLVDATLGNPLFALELGRVLAEHGAPAIGEELPVPEAVEDLLGTRVGRLPAPQRKLLLAVALSADLRASHLAAIGDPGEVEDAVEDGLLLVEGDRVRASHPLLAAAARKRSRPSGRRELHLALAGVVADEELRARHLALAADRPNPGLAATVGSAAAAASARGARQEAVELAEHALRLTPPEARERSDRLLALAAYLETAGELQRVTDLLTPELDSLTAGAPRARAWLLLAEGGSIRSVDDYKHHLEQALAESEREPGLHASALAKMSSAVIGVERISEAETEMSEVLAVGRRAGPDVERLVLYALAWARGLRGRPIDDLCKRFDALSDSASYMVESPERVAGQRLVWRGELDEARALFAQLLSVADERGEPASYAMQRLHLCELALRAGELESATRLLDEWAESSERELLVSPMYERCRALLAAGRGLPEEAVRWAADAIARAETTGVSWDRLEALRARGLAALLAHEPARAAESLGAAWEHTQREGVEEPGVFPVAPDLVEALVELGELDEAAAVAARLREQAEEQAHPWGLATAKRCEALVRLASQKDEVAASDLEQAAAAYGELGLRFDRARTLLLLGRDQRRRKKWAAARRALEQAAALFDELGAPGWVEEARSELARVGARKPQPSGELTPTERRVAELAAEGLSNKEIARTLFVTVHTVEVHLSHAYAKLGVRSRSQLSSRLTST